MVRGLRSRVNIPSIFRHLFRFLRFKGHPLHTKDCLRPSVLRHFQSSFRDFHAELVSRKNRSPAQADFRPKLPPRLRLRPFRGCLALRRSGGSRRFSPRKSRFAFPETEPGQPLKGCSANPRPPNRTPQYFAERAQRRISTTISLSRCVFFSNHRVCTSSAFHGAAVHSFPFLWRSRYFFIIFFFSIVFFAHVKRFGHRCVRRNFSGSNDRVACFFLARR